MIETGEARDPQRKQEELRSFLFLTAVMVPVLSVIIVAGYGFIVWMTQLISGPPSH
ncbi:MAG: periplasmic nitrate reductase, NapE protein [Cupriavidus necator]